MDIRDFLSRLHVERGPGTTGEYTCRCPAHDDKTASLCVRQSENGSILVKCQAGCTTESVIQAMHLTMRDLFPDGGRGRHDDRKSGLPPKKTGKPAGESKSKPLGELTKVYDYTDEAGQLLFQVCRYEQTIDGKREKTFRPRVPDGRHGWRYGAPEALRYNTIYRMPEVAAAIREGRTVFVVEGEKDADNLAVLGYTATTQPGGAGKWKDGHTKRLAGADVVVIPDNDTEDNKFVGQEHARHVAGSLVGIAKRVRLIDLAKECPELPPKGDVTDFFQILGRKKGEELLLKLVDEAEDYQPEKALENLYDKAVEYYAGLPGYCVDRGCICQLNDDNPKRLCTFVALPSAVILRDDGVNTQKLMIIEGWSQTGERLPQARVMAKDFRSMNWVMENWDFQANIVPGQATVDKLRYAIAEIGKHAERRTEYAHTGWRKIGGKWCYLYHGGAIGAQGVSVDLGSGMQTYRLDGSGAEGFDKLTPADGLAICRMYEAVVAGHISIPLLAMTYLAPLRDALVRGGIAPSFSIFLHGSTGTRKSTVSALALAHFGNFTARNLPASFQDTANYVRKKAFLLKDTLLIVDDYHPVTSQQERRKREDMAQSLSRAFGDGNERGRMNSNLQLQEAMPPRCVAILSGEDMPVIGESGTARYYVINVGKDDVPLGEEMTIMQDAARDGYLQRAMRGYIEWLLPRMEALPGQLIKRFKQFRTEAQKAVSEKGAHPRMPEVIAHLMIGYEQMALYMISQGVLTESEGAEAIENAWRVIVPTPAARAMKHAMTVQAGCT